MKTKFLLTVILASLLSGSAFGQEIIYNKDKLFQESIEQLILIDSLTVLAKSGYDDYSLKAIDLGATSETRTLLPYKVDKIVYNAVDEVIAALPYGDYANPNHEKRVKIIDKAGREQSVLPAQNDVAFSTDGVLLFGIDEYQNIRAYDWKESSAVDSLKWNGYAQALYSLSDSSVVIYDYQQEKGAIWTWQLHEKPQKIYQTDHEINQILPSSEYIVVAKKLEEVEYYNRVQITVLSRDGEIIQKWVEEGDAQKLSLNADAGFLAATDRLDKLLLWQWDGGQFNPVESDLESIEAEDFFFSARDDLLILVNFGEVSFFSLQDFAIVETISLINNDRYFSGAAATSSQGENYVFAFSDEDYRGGLIGVNFSKEQETTKPVAKNEEPSGDKAAVVLQSGHQNEISSIVFGKNDQVLFTGDADGRLIKWDLKSGLHYQPISLFGRDEVYSGGYSGESPIDLAFNSAMNHLAVVGDNSPSLPILDAQTMTRRFTIPVNGLPAQPAFSPDGTLFAFAENQKVKIYAVSQSEYRLLHTIPVDAQVNDLLFDPGSKLLAAAKINDLVELIDAKQGKIVQTWEGHTASVTELAFSPDGRWLYSLDFSSNIRRWNMDAKTGDLFYESTYSGTSSFTMEDGEITKHLRITDISVAKNGEYLYSIGDSFGNTDDNEPVYSILAWDAETKKQLTYFETEEAPDIMNVFATAGNGHVLATGGLDQEVRLWDAQSSQLQKTFGNPIPEIEDAIPYYQKEVVVSTQSNSEDYYRLQQWDIPGLKIEQSLDGVKFGTQNLVLDEERGMIATDFASRHTWMSFENLADSNSFTPQNYYGHSHASPEGGFLFGYEISDKNGESGFNPSKNITIDVYNTGNTEKVYTIETEGYANAVNYYASFIPRFNINRRLFALQTGREQLTLYDYHTGQQKKIIETDQRITNAQFSDTYLYIWSQTGITRVDLDSFDQTIVQTFTDFMYDPQSNLGAASTDLNNDRLAWVAEIKEGVQVGRTKSFGLKIFNTETSQLQQASLSEVPQKLFFIDDGKKVVAVFKNYLALFSTDDAKLIGSLVPVAGEDYFFYTPDFFYASSRDAYKAVGFQFQNQMVSFDQLDLWYNRPDILMSRMMMADTKSTELVYEAYTKRLNQAGFEAGNAPDLSALPSIAISNELPTASDEKNISFSIEAADSLHSLTSLHVYANGVPIWGQQGKKISGNEYTGQVNLDLLAGENKIQVSARNKLGFESLRETREIEYNPLDTAESNLYLVSVNVSDYLSDNDLQYARKDGQDLTGLYAEKAAEFYDNIYVDTLFDEQATLENINALKEKLLKTNPQDRVILFISGHGLLDKSYDFYFATYDTDFSNPAARGISYSQIEWLLDGIPARRKLLLIDACHSGEVDKESLPDTNEALAENVTQTFDGAKGVGSISSGDVGLENSFTLMQQLFTNLNRGSGTVVISAAAGNSYALESPEWRNGVFTYAILDGLKNMEADENKNGEITVSELRQYVYAKVVEETGGRQKPTTRQENLEFDFRVW